METKTIKLYSLSYTTTATYLLAAAFVVGNLLLPQLCHLLPVGGKVLLPIYFFTLIGAYKYGWRVGLLTAILSPIINSALFGMPAVEILPIILIKSTLLAIAASWTAHKSRQISVLLLTAVVLSYQLVGTIAEWAILRDLSLAVQDFRLGLLGMLVQIFGGYVVIKYLIKN